MGLPSGLSGQWCAEDEGTYGVTPSLSSALFYAWRSDTLKLRKVPKQGTGIFAGSQVARAVRRVVPEYSAGGGLVGELAARGLNTWLYRMMGSYGQSTAALTEDSTTGAYSATHALGSLTGHSFALQAGRPAINGTVEPATYVGCKISEWEISCALGDIAELTLTIEARNELAGTNTDPLNMSVPALESYTAPVAGGVFEWVGASVYYGGTPSTTSGVTSLSSPTLAGNIKGPISFKLSRALDLERYSPDVAPYRNEPLQNGLVLPSGSHVVEWLSSETWYNAYANDTTTSIEYQFLGPAIGTGSDFSTFSILVPNVKLEGESPSVGGPQVLTQTLPWTGLSDGVNNDVQVTYWTLDSA